MDAEKFALTVIMGCIIAAVVSVSLAVAKRFKIKLPWDATITGCPKCGAAEDFKPGMTRDMIGTDGPVVRREPRSGSMDDLVNVVAVISGIGVTLVGCVLLLSGVAAWVVGGSGISVAIIALPLGIQASTWGWRRGLLPPVVACKACGWRDPKYAV